MSPLLRSLSFLFLGSLFLIAIPLYAEGPPPVPQLPRSNTNDAELNGLKTFFGSRAPSQQTNTSGTTVQAAYQSEQSLEQLPPPNLVKQVSVASFSPPLAASVSALPEESPYERQTNELFYDDEEYQEVYNAMLDKPLGSQKQTRMNDNFDKSGEDEFNAGGWNNKLAKPELTPFISVGGSLLIVIAAFFLLVILFRKVSPERNRPLPKEAFECLGRYFLTQKHQLQVLRMGNRIVLVSVMPDGVSTLAEITDPDETVSFLGLCRRLDTNSATEMFRKTVASMTEEELSRPHARPVVTARRMTPPTSASFDMYSDPDESIAAILARGRR